jgi:hypothetical protein
LRNGLRQLISFQVDSDIETLPLPFVVNSIREIDPRLVPPFLKSPLARGRFPTGPVRIVIGVGVGLSLLVIGYLAIAFRSRLERKAWMFVLVMATGIAANALAIGGLAEIHDRYGNRVIWLLPLTALVLIFVAIQRNRSVIQPTV